jgi:tetratricopeptide (TPR) repeat protein
MAAFRQAIQLDENASQAHTNLGIALQAKGNPDGAVDEHRKAIQLNPQSTEAYNHLGTALQAKKDFGRAIAAFRKAISLDPTSAANRTNLGAALQQKGDLDGALAEHRRAVQLDPESALAHSHLGFALRAKGDLDGSIDAYRKAIQLNPQSALDHSHLGFNLRAKGDLDGALDAYRRAIQLNPKSALDHCKVGEILQSMGELDGAIDAYRQAVSLDPNAVYAQNSLRAAQQMQEGKYRVAGALEGEKLKVLGRSSDYYVGPQEMSRFLDGQWSGNAQLYAQPPKVGSWADLELPGAKAGKYEVIVYLTKAPDYGIVRFRLDGKELGKPIDCYEPEVLRTGALSLGTTELKKSPAVLRIEVTGSNPRSVGLRTMWGLDCVVLKPVKP